MESTKFVIDQVKAKTTKECTLQVKTILDADLIMHNTIMAICAYAVPVMHYTFGVVKWNKDELAKLDTKMYKILTKCRFHHPCSNVHHLYLN
eukprot:9611311-Ditylum_brightwellii.AAC.3